MSSNIDQVTVLWVEEHLPEAWKARASEIKEVLQAELFTTIASIRQATPETLRLIQIDKKPLPIAVISALQRPEEKCCFPPLGKRIVGDSMPSLPNAFQHLPARIREASLMTEFPFSPVTATSDYMETIWAIKKSCDLQWSHEPDIQEFVKHALFDILHMYDIPVSLVREVSVTQNQPDFWIVKFLGTPIGVIEVKIPLDGEDDEATLRDERAAGQVLDYLLTLRSTVGLCGPVFAILCTYRSWRPFWLCSRAHAIEKTATADRRLREQFNNLYVSETSEGTIDDYEENEVCEDEPTGDQNTSFIDHLWNQFREYDMLDSDCELTAAEPLPQTPKKREVFADHHIYDIRDSVTLRNIIVHVLLLMCANSKLKQPVNIHKNLLLAANDKQWLWIEPLSKAFKLHPDKFPNNNAQQLVLLADLGAGLHGRVWLACSTGGAVCMLKFFSEYGSAEKELEFWKRVYPNSKARIQTFMGKDSLLMPAFPPCPKEKRSLPEVRNAVNKAVTDLLAMRINHGDLKWANFGFHGTGNSLKAYAFDFGKSMLFNASDCVQMEENAKNQLAKMFAER